MANLKSPIEKTAPSIKSTQDQNSFPPTVAPKCYIYATHHLNAGTCYHFVVSIKRSARAAQLYEAI